MNAFRSFDFQDNVDHKLRSVQAVFWSRDQRGLQGLVTNCLHLILSLVIDAASLRSLPHHFRMSSIHLRAGLP